MPYESRLLADGNYLMALGRAFYNFTYLEWTVVWTIVKLSTDGFGSVPKGKSAIWIADALKNAIKVSSPPLSEPLKNALTEFERGYREAIKVRNKLLHAHPYTSPGGLSTNSWRGIRMDH